MRSTRTPAALRVLGWVTITLVLAAGGQLLRPVPDGMSLGPRLLGPLRPLVVAVQWVRVENAFAAGQTARAFVLAEQALELDPQDPGLWTALVWRQAVQFASPEREPDPARRGRWLASAIDLAERGQDFVGRPGELSRLAGDVIQIQLRIGGTLPDWPGGREGLLEEAERHYRRALERGDTRAELGLAGLDQLR